MTRHILGSCFSSTLHSQQCLITSKLILSICIRMYIANSINNNWLQGRRPSSTVYKTALYPIDEGQHAWIALVCSPGSCTALLHCEISLLSCIAVAIVCTCVPSCMNMHSTYVRMYRAVHTLPLVFINSVQACCIIKHEVELIVIFTSPTYSSAGSTARRQIGGWGNWTRTSNRPFKKQRQESGQRSVTK